MPNTARGSVPHRLSQASNSHLPSASPTYFSSSHRDMQSHRGSNAHRGSTAVAIDLRSSLPDLPSTVDDYASQNNTDSDEPEPGEINLAPGQLPPYFSPLSGASPRMDPSPANSLKGNGSFHLDMHENSFPDLEMLVLDDEKAPAPGPPPGRLSTADAAKILGYLPEDVRGAVGQWLPSSVRFQFFNTSNFEQFYKNVVVDFQICC